MPDNTPFDPAELDLRPSRKTRTKMYHVPATGSADQPARSQEVVYDLDLQADPIPSLTPSPAAPAASESIAAPTSASSRLAGFETPVSSASPSTPASPRTTTPEPVSRAFTEPVAQNPVAPTASAAPRTPTTPAAPVSVAPSPFEVEPLAPAAARAAKPSFKPLAGFGRRTTEPAATTSADAVDASPFEDAADPGFNASFDSSFTTEFAPDLELSAVAVAAQPAVGHAVDTLIETDRRDTSARRGADQTEPPPLALRDVREFVEPSRLPVDELDKLEGIRCHPPQRAVRKYVLVLDEFENTPGLLDTFLREHAMSVAGVNIQPVRATKKNAFVRACEAAWVYGPINAARHGVRRLTKRARSKVFEGWFRQTRSPIRPATVCTRYGVKAESHADVNSPEFIKHLTDHGVELLVCVGTHQIFSEALRSSIPFGAINVHGSLLPHYRGQQPTLHALADNQRTGGVSVHYATRYLHDGPVLAERAYTTHTHDTVADVLRRSREVAGDALLQAVRKIEFGTLTMAPNTETVARVCDKPRRRDLRRVRKTGRKLG